VLAQQRYSYGNLISNNWEENPNGEVYRRWLGARRRSDVQRAVDDILRPQVQAINDSWRIRKSGETEGSPRAATPGEIARGAPSAGPTQAQPEARSPPAAAMPVLPNEFLPSMNGIHPHDFSARKAGS
jgi:hypothetical protein